MCRPPSIEHLLTEPLPSEPEIELSEWEAYVPGAGGPWGDEWFPLGADGQNFADQGWIPLDAEMMNQLWGANGPPAGVVGARF